MVLRLLALVLPLGLDTFAVAAALGVAGLGRAQRARVSVVFAVFEGGMPLLGLLLGAGLGGLLGGAATWVAVAALVGVAIFMLTGDDDEGAGVERARGTALLALGVGISIDELAIGFAGGLLRLPLLLAVILVATQAVLASQLGMALGARVGAAFREGAERLAAAALLILALVLALQRLTGAD